MKTIAIIGGRGYIGKQLHSVLTAAASARCSNQLKIVIGSRNCSENSVDITEPNQLNRFVANADVVVNLVGIMEPQPPRYTFQSVHHQGPRNLAKAIKGADPSKKRLLIHLSALGADLQSPIPYPQSKAQGEQAIKQELTGVENVRAVIIRPGLVIGPSDNFLNRFSMLLRYLPVFPVFGRAKDALYQPIYCRDLCQLVRNLCLQHHQLFEGTEAGETSVVEVGGSQTLPFKSILQETAPSRPPFLPPYLLPVPVSVGLAQSWLMERLIPVGSALRITQDQVRLLQLDNCVHGSSVTLSKRSAVISIGASYSVPGDKSMGQLAERIMFSTFDLAGQRQQLKGLSDLFAKGQWKAESNK